MEPRASTAVPAAAAPGRLDLARVGPAVAALATFTLHAACGGRYGLFRDELYYMVCGQRLAAGYVDQPPGVAVVAGIAHGLFGTWLPGVRFFAWLATAATVYLAGRLAARLAPASDGPAATMAAVATFACLVLRGTSHFLSMNAFEPLLLMGLVLVLLRLAAGEDPRLWLAAGGLAGLAVLFKYSAAPVAIGLVVGLLATPARRALRTRWALAGAAVGLLVVLPNAAWQAAHGLPFLELVRNGVLRKNVAMSPLQFLGNLAFEANPGNLPIWLGGLAWLLVPGSRAPRAARFVGIGCLLQLLALTLGHAKPYYAAGVLPVLLAAGGAAFASLVRHRLVQRVYFAGLVASALVFAPLAVPILPEPVFVAYQRALGMGAAPTEKLAQSPLPQVFADMHGWHELVEGVARVYRALPPGERERVAIFGKNYGVAAAVELLGPEHGLPRGLAVSGHNSFWLWGLPAGRGDPLVVVGGPMDDCEGLYHEWTIGEQLPRTPYVMPYEDAHTLIVCRGAREPLRGLPPALRHFD